MPGAYTLATGSGQIPGLTIYAWAMINASGTVIKSSGVSSAIRNSIGNYTVTLANPMADHVSFVGVASTMGPGGPQAAGVGGLTTSTVSVYTYQNAVAWDPTMFYVAIYR